MKRAKHPFTVIVIAALLASGCATGIVERPDLNRLVYDEAGVLRYEGKRVEGIKLELPWYKEMWPDSPSEWAFTLITAGATAAFSSSGGSGSSGGGEEVVVAPVEDSSNTTSKPRDDSSTQTSTTTAPSSGGGTTPPPAPPSGGGFELPF